MQAENYVLHCYKPCNLFSVGWDVLIQMALVSNH